MSEVKVGIQLIVFNNREKKDLKGVLKYCKETGVGIIISKML